ncbi:MAG: hypothetical protein COB59_11700 [Rhodospirillaceae bacterium]|nr:MAG: hypothetical protein COB59_11700 [Rhodospirillaceae bacterium]
MKNLNSTLSANSAANEEDVIATKIFLRNQGHYIPPEWGISQFPDQAMFDSIREFQKSQGLKVDGVMKPEGETETAIKEHALARFLDTKSIQGAAQQLQSKGRNGDTILAHITPAEAQLLHDVTDGGSINPETGLPEFFFGDFFSGMSDSFSSIGTSLSDSFSSFGDSFSSSLSEFGDSFSSGLNDTFGDGFSDKLGGVAGNVTSQLAGNYVSKKVGGEFGNMLGGAVGSTLGNTVSGAFSSSDTSAQPKATDTNTFGGLNNGMNAQAASLPKSTPKINLNPKAGQTHVGAAQQTRNVKILNKQRDVAAQQSTIPKKAPLTLNQKIEATTKKMNATRIAEQKAKMPASQQAIYNDLVAKAKAGRQKILAQQGRPQASKFLGTDSPTRAAEVPASQARTATPAYKISAEDDAAIGREADGIVKTKNLEGPLKYHKDAYATGTPKAKAEFENFLGKVHDKDPEKAQDIITNMRKSGFDVGGEKSAVQNVLDGPSMDESGNWFDQSGKQIEDPYRNENFQLASDNKTVPETTPETKEVPEPNSNVNAPDMLKEIEAAKQGAQHISSGYDEGSPECVALVKHFRKDLGQTKLWRAGEAVSDKTSIAVGDALAYGFNEEGGYESNPRGNHAVIVTSVDAANNTVTIAEQWGPRPKRKRLGQPVRTKTLTIQQLTKKNYHIIETMKKKK